MVPDLGDTVESAHTIGRASTRSARVDVLPRAERRHRWTAEQKLAMVGESLGPGLTPTGIGRKQGISRGQIYVNSGYYGRSVIFALMRSPASPAIRPSRLDCLPRYPMGKSQGIPVRQGS
jgi:hypothetical protein